MFYPPSTNLKNSIGVLTGLTCSLVKKEPVNSLSLNSPSYQKVFNLSFSFLFNFMLFHIYPPTLSNFNFLSHSSSLFSIFVPIHPLLYFCPIHSLSELILPFLFLHFFSYFILEFNIPCLKNERIHLFLGELIKLPFLFLAILQFLQKNLYF